MVIDASILLILAATVAAGVFGAVLRAWSVLSDLKLHDRRITMIEAGLTTEIKRRAGEIRQATKRNVADEVADLKQSLVGAQSQKQPWDL